MISGREFAAVPAEAVSGIGAPRRRGQTREICLIPEADNRAARSRGAPKPRRADHVPRANRHNARVSSATAGFRQRFALRVLPGGKNPIGIVKELPASSGGGGGNGCAR